MRRHGLIGIALATGCGHVVDSSFDAGQFSGTRLKLSYYDFDDTRTIAGIYDAMRQETCEARLWNDGNYYCTPTSAESVAYADAACTNKIGLVSNDPCAAPAYLAEYDYSACDVPVKHLYKLGPSVSMTEYWYQSGPNCIGPVSTQQRSAYAVGSEISASDLVNIAVGAYQGAARLQQRFLTSRDGLRLLSRYQRDSQLNITCYVGSSIGGTAGICAPSQDAPISYFQDAGCTAAVAATRTSCDKPELAVKLNACGANNYFALGAQVGTDSLYVGTPSACHSDAALPEISYFSVGQEVALAAPQRHPAQRGQRIAPIDFTMDGFERQDIPLYDREIKTECMPFKLGDGNAYCLPFGAAVSSYYTDATCNAPVDVATVYRGPDSCTSLPVPEYALKESHNPSCATTNVSRAIAAPHAGQLYESTLGHCTRHVVASGYVDYDLGSPIPETGLASGRFEIDH